MSFEKKAERKVLKNAFKLDLERLRRLDKGFIFENIFNITSWKINMGPDFYRDTYVEMIFLLKQQFHELKNILEDGNVVFFWNMLKKIHETVFDFNYIYFDDSANLEELNDRVKKFYIHSGYKESDNIIELLKSFNAQVNDSKKKEYEWNRKEFFKDNGNKKYSYWTGKQRRQIYDEKFYSIYEIINQNAHSNYFNLKFLYKFSESDTWEQMVLNYEIDLIILTLQKIYEKENINKFKLIELMPGKEELKIIK